MSTEAPLNTVQSLIDDVRTLLLDETQPYRYENTELLVALNTALLEARRVRADLFVTRWGANAVPYYTAVSGEPFCVEAQFRLAFVYGVVSHALLRDDEEVQDARANTFLTRFYYMLGATPPAAIRGATPAPKKAQE